MISYLYHNYIRNFLLIWCCFCLSLVTCLYVVVGMLCKHTLVSKIILHYTWIVIIVLPQALEVCADYIYSTHFIASFFSVFFNNSIDFTCSSCRLLTSCSSLAIYSNMISSSLPEKIISPSSSKRIPTLHYSLLLFQLPSLCTTLTTVHFTKIFDKNDK